MAAASPPLSWSPDDPPADDGLDPALIAAFISRWSAATGSERANHPKDRQIHEQGLVSVLRQLHDELDAAVLAAYGWEDLAAALVATPVGAASRRVGPGADTGAEDPAGTRLAPTESGMALDQAAAVEETLLQRLVALNAERAAEERRGLIRWLRPDFQHPGGGATPQAEATMTATTTASARSTPPTWPKASPAPPAPASPNSWTPSPPWGTSAGCRMGATSPASPLPE